MIEIKVEDKTYTLITLAHGEQREMTSQESAMVTQIMLTSMAANDHPFNGDAVDMFLSATEPLSFPEAVLLQRLQLHKIRVSGAVALIVLALSRTPGDIVMWCWTLHHMKPTIPMITVRDWALAFAGGVPSEKTRELCWDSQKGPRGNLLDVESTWSK